MHSKITKVPHNPALMDNINEYLPGTFSLVKDVKNSDAAVLE